MSQLGTPIRPAAPIVKPAAPKSAAKITDHQDRLDESHHHLRKIDLTSQDLYSLKLDEIRSFDRESLIELSTLLLSRQNASSSSALASDHFSSSTDPSKENARLQATIEILKVRDVNACVCAFNQHFFSFPKLMPSQGRIAVESGVGIGYDSVSYLQTELISAMVN